MYARSSPVRVCTLGHWVSGLFRASIPWTHTQPLFTFPIRTTVTAEMHPDRVTICVCMYNTGYARKCNIISPPLRLSLVIAVKTDNPYRWRTVFFFFFLCRHHTVRFDVPLAAVFVDVRRVRRVIAFLSAAFVTYNIFRAAVWRHSDKV